MKWTKYEINWILLIYTSSFEISISYNEYYMSMAASISKNKSLKNTSDPKTISQNM